MSAPSLLFSTLFSCTTDEDVLQRVSRLKPLDIEIMKRLGTRVNLIPVVAKADTLTQHDLAVFKQRVRIFFVFSFKAAELSNRVSQL